VVALRVVARIPAVDRQQPALLRSPDHAEAGALGDEFGEQADEVDAHGGIGIRKRRQAGTAAAATSPPAGQKSASQSTVTQPASVTTETMESGTRKGIIRSRSPRATSTSSAPVENGCETTPKSAPSVLRTRRPSRSTQ